MRAAGRDGSSAYDHLFSDGAVAGDEDLFRSPRLGVPDLVTASMILTFVVPAKLV
jgi:hypothetical protein